MGSFRTQRARVLDETLPLHRRHLALRYCVAEFPAYGFQATYHHLTVHQRRPGGPVTDPAWLLRAVGELHEARELWVAAGREYAARRKTEKRAGLRAATRPEHRWRSAGWSVPDDALCHPALSLPAYVRRRLLVLRGAELPGCERCGDERGPLSRSTGHGFLDLCRGCGLLRSPCACGPHHLRAPEPRLWGALWRGEHLTDTGAAAPGRPGTVEERLSGLELSLPVRRWWGTRSP
ncbi:hypothetical protein ACIRBX_34320 [Kitasatospora sp. NPDC096147]|uniref:hypothetical protein n=1 Tax=Kitasatospora sp. NPDC096147 TaxID=3364093 RepID=UPI0038230BDA